MHQHHSDVYFDAKFKVKDSINSVSILELKRLLFDLKDSRSDVCVRFRLLGKFWNPSFMHVVSIGDRDAKFFNPTEKISVEVSDLANIVQFELDKKFQKFQPLFHYDVLWNPDL